MEDKIRKVIREQIKKLGEGTLNEEGMSSGLETRQLADSFTFGELEQLYINNKITKADLNGAKNYLQAWIDQHPSYLPQRDLNTSKRQSIRSYYLDPDRTTPKGGTQSSQFEEIAKELGYLNESFNNITLHTDMALYEEERANLEDLKSYPFPTGAEITVPALGPAKFANNIETRIKTEDPSTQWGIDYYLGEFENEYGPTEFEVAEDLGNRYTLTPIDNPKFDAAYERDRQKQIDRREKSPGWQRRDNMGNYTDPWS